MKRFLIYLGIILIAAILHATNWPHIGIMVYIAAGYYLGASRKPDSIYG